MKSADNHNGPDQIDLIESAAAEVERPSTGSRRGSVPRNGEPPPGFHTLAAPRRDRLARRPAPAHARPEVRGKFLSVGSKKYYVRGVTYGTFRPDDEGVEFPAQAVVEHDFAQMAANGVNTVRTYTLPPRRLLDAAQDHGLRVLAGLPVERSVAFMDYRKCAQDLETMVRTGVQACAAHPAILAYTIGNEIPASIVRWHGPRRLERFLGRLCAAAKAEDPGCLVTYVNYPSTEYLRLPFLDFVAFNVYLESARTFDAYLARLHNLAPEQPVVMAEMGLDSYRHGELTQAQTLDWQVRTAFAAGCAGVFVYAWTDEWFRGGAEVEDWEFGLTDRQRQPKPSLTAVREAFKEAPFAPDLPWPRVSVVVCSCNGARTLRDCLQGLLQLDYPDYEVIVVDDGSTDRTAAIAGEYCCRVISTPNRGLSHARNIGWQAATGNIVAYIDDDAFPDVDWLRYLAVTFLNSSYTAYAAVGGPNLAPPSDGAIAQCVAHAPGGPTHVLLSDREAEHIPGCNMAFRKSCLEVIGGFDPQFRVAGDDVDVCWRLQQQGWKLGFSAAAIVWHHRRSSVRTYLRQQRGYGRAEALLEKKWPAKYNCAGHLKWVGRVYGGAWLSWRPARIYHGIWGLAPFQLLYEPTPGLAGALPTMPEWYLLICMLAGLSILGLHWRPLLSCVPLLLLAVAAPLAQAGRCAAHARLAGASADRGRSGRMRLLIACLHLLQPMARLAGRLRHGLTIWRMRLIAGWAVPRPWLANIWSRRSLSIHARLAALEAALRPHAAVPVRGGDFDPWDLEVRGGLLGSARMSVAVEYHGDGRQLLRIRSWPHSSVVGLLVTLLLAGLALDAGRDQSWGPCALISGVTLLIGARTLYECAAATAAFLRAVRVIEKEEEGHVGN
ncbi:MAG: glycosyltransferase [Verrucomicrobia bacterium]|nr:glycosyltransferase [Verrucomicrobiota bacterium]